MWVYTEGVNFLENLFIQIIPLSIVINQIRFFLRFSQKRGFDECFY